ncbi:MAG: sigma-70 family RNA polymerase sigma factor [Candidatus Eisenbacteria bacterium]|nr:sigma-70 family RNA polymerase sigma factor [Candidatus Eisenbacteria bacterium]
MQSPPSLVLLERMQHGDADARDELLRRYWPRLERWAHGRLPRGARDLHDTTDLVQETLVAALQRLQEFRPEHEGALQAYLRVALLNRIRSLAVRGRRRGEIVPLESLLADRAPSPLEEAIGREALETYEAALHRLRPEDREAIVLRIELDLPYEEVARALGKPNVIAARKALSRALVRLAQEMRGRA